MSRKTLYEPTACLYAGDAMPSHLGDTEGWRQSLEIIGAELFQRYRKRLMTPGIALEIRRDFPGLALPDILLRVHAGRRILQDGDDFRALAAIRSGRWRCHLAACERARVEQQTAGDRVSCWMVQLGGLLFIGFCALSLIAVLPGGAGDGALLLSIFALGLGIVAWWWRAPYGVQRRSISSPEPRRAGICTAAEMRAGGQRGAVSSA